MCIDDNDVRYDDRPVSEILAELTGRPESDFEADEYDLPPLDEWIVVDDE